MTEKQHTPTPWHTSPSAGHEIHGQHLIYREIDGKTVALTYTNAEDAAFIVRAVNSYDVMRKALLAAQDDYRDLLRAGPTNEEADEIDELLQTIDAALKLDDA